MMRVLVTRPQVDAERTAQRLAARGHEAVIAPVLRIAPTADPMPPGLFAAVIFTSANGVAALGALGTWDDRLPVFAVGDRTASAAATAGIRDVRSAAGDAASLASLLASTVSPGARLLHVAGRDRKPEPEASLAAAGFSIATWTAYAAVPVERLAEAACVSLTDGWLDAALHYSHRSAALLIQRAGDAGLAHELLAVSHVCLSPDVAAPLRGAGAPHVRVAERPDEDALLAALDSEKSRAAGSRKTRSG